MHLWILKAELWRSSCSTTSSLYCKTEWCFLHFWLNWLRPSLKSCPLCHSAVLMMSEGWWVTPLSAEQESYAPLAFLMKPESAEWDLYLCRALYHAAVDETQSCYFLAYDFFLQTVENTVYTVSDMKIAMCLIQLWTKFS